MREGTSRDGARGGWLRREFVLTALVGAIAVLALRIGQRMADPMWRHRLRRGWPRIEGFGRAPDDRLRAHFDYLEVDPETLDRYLADYQHRYGALGRFSLPRSDFYTRFLLSTDFFQNGADESRPLRYVAFYHPHESPCYNPLARFS